MSEFGKICWKKKILNPVDEDGHTWQRRKRSVFEEKEQYGKITGQLIQGHQPWGQATVGLWANGGFRNKLLELGSINRAFSSIALHLN